MNAEVLDIILGSHSAILGKTGSGKTSTAKLAIERRAEQGGHVCILDPIKSDWWGLASSRDGKKPGLPFNILGGPRGHVSLHHASGKAIAEIVANGSLPLSIIDMADFPPGGQSKFFIDFAPTLLRKMRGVVTLVLEEAHLFAPKERSGIGDENMAIHWAKMLATAGRSKGIRLMLVTQRTQALHNALLGSCETMVAHRLTAPADQKPLIDWLKANITKDIIETVSSNLSSLKTGTAWVCSGEAKFFEMVKFGRISTYDNSATPVHGAAGSEAVKTATVDLEKLQAIMGAAAKEIEANDPKALKAELSALRKQMAEAVGRKVVADPADIERAEQRGYERGLQASAQAIRGALSDAKDAIGAVVTDHLSNLAKALPATTVKAPQTYSKPIPAPVSPRAPRLAPKGNGTVNVSLPPGERAVLIAAAQFDPVEREQLTILTGYKRSSRDAYIQRLREKGYVEVSGSSVTITPSGEDALPADYSPLPTGVDLQGYWLGRLPEGERRILENLIEAYPNAVERTDLDEATGYKRSSRDAYLQRMKAKRLWDPAGAGIRASEILFA